MHSCKSRYVWAIYSWLLEIELFKTKLKQIKTKHKTKQNKKNPNYIKSGLSQFLFLQQKMKYVVLMATFIK